MSGESPPRSLTCECGNAKPFKAVGCSRCLTIESWRVRAESHRYYIEQRLARFDWLTSSDLYDSMDADVGDTRRLRLSQSLHAMLAAGLVEQRLVCGEYEYRLVRRGGRRAA